MKEDRTMTMNTPRYLSGKEQDRMIANGWRIELAESCGESPEKMFERLSSTTYYKQVKIYYTSTQIRGLYKYFAMVK